MRWADMDLLGHVNNVVYVDYLQEARVDMLRVHARKEATGDLAEALVVVRHEVHYRAPLTFRFKPVSIECWVTDIRAASFTMAYEVFHDDGDGRGGAPRLPARDHRADAVPLRLRATPPARPRRADRPGALRRGAARLGHRRTRPGDSRRDPVGHYPVHVRFSDVDVYGHVNNVKYFEYFMEARILFNARLWRDLADEGDAPPVSMVVARPTSTTRSPILFRPEPYDAWSWLTPGR